MSERGQQRFSSEHGEQVTLFDWARCMLGAYPQLEWMFAIPNGGKRDKATAARLKDEGVKAGVPDICLAYPAGKWHGLFIEMKYGDNAPTAQQECWIRALNTAGYLAVVAWGFEAAKEVIEAYLEGRM